MQKHIKKSSKAISIGQIYALLGTTNQTVSYWRNNPMNTSTIYQSKYNVILKAGTLFELSNFEQEQLANKAGLSLWPFLAKSNNNSNIILEMSDEVFPYSENYQYRLRFIEHFEKVLSTFNGTMMELSNMALISDRHLRHMKNGINLRKESLLAVLVVLGLDVSEIQSILNKAGFALSESLPNDVIVTWMLTNEEKGINTTQWLVRINEELDSLGLPLLLPREKNK